MKDMFNKRQRFSLRKYSFGVASVLLGVTLFSNAQAAQAEEAGSPATTAELVASTEAVANPSEAAVSPAVTSEATISAPVSEAVSEASTAALTSDVASTSAEASATALNSESQAATSTSVASTASTSASVATGANTNAAVAATGSSAFRSVSAASGVSDLRAAGNTATVTTADPTDGTDTMPSDSTVTDRSKPKVNASLGLPDNPIVNNLPGNTVTPTVLSGIEAAFALNDPKKRVAEIWGLQEDGIDDHRFVALDYLMDSDAYEIRVFDSGKNLVRTISLPARGKTVLNIGTNKSPVGGNHGYGVFTFDNSDGTAVASFLRYADWVPGQDDGTTAAVSPRIRKVYSTTRFGNVPDSYDYSSVSNFSNVNPWTFSTTLQSKTGFSVSYLDQETNQQVAPTTEIKDIYSGDTFNTVEATESDFLANARNKGYELVSVTPKTDGKVVGSYWGGKGSVVVADFDKSPEDIRVRYTVIDDKGNVQVEAWHRPTGRKLWIAGYTELQADGTEKYVALPTKQITAPDSLNPSGTETYTVPAEEIYVSKPLRPINADQVKDSSNKVIRAHFWFWTAHENDTTSDGLIRRGSNVSLSNGYVEPMSDVVYYYARPKGDVTVEYYIQGENTKIAADQKAADQVSVKETYNAGTSALRPNEITSNGKTYRLVTDSTGAPVLRTGSAAVTGTVEKQTQTVQYQYALVRYGSVDVTYKAEDGTILEGPTAVVTNQEEGTAYTTSQKTFAGYTFKGLETGSAQAAGNVVADQTLHVVYVYSPVVAKTGSVDVTYKAEDGTILEGPTAVVTNQEEGTAYTTNQKTFAGYTFKGLETGSAQASGNVVADQILHVVYVYSPVVAQQNADITIVAVDANGNAMTVGRQSGTTTTALVDGVLETSANLQGQAGDKVEDKAKAAGFDYQALIAKYQKLGYQVQAGSYTGTGSLASKGTMIAYDGTQTFDSDASSDQHFVIKLTPIIVPFDPNTPVKPNETVPGLPNNPTYPTPDNAAAEDANQLKATVVRTVTYFTEDKDGNNKTAIAQSAIATKSDTLYFRRTGTINLVTGEVVLNGWTVTDSDYTADSTATTADFAAYASPVYKGYILKSESYRNAGAHTGVQATDADYNDQVIYVPIANYVPQWPTGDTPSNPWTGVPYTNDPTDPAKIVTPQDPAQGHIPYVPGYTPQDPSGNPLTPVDPTDPSKGYYPPSPTSATENTVIPYTRNGNVIVKYVDDKGNTLQADRTDLSDAPVGTNYDTNEAGENPSRITTSDGKIYALTGVDGNEKGQVVSGTTTVTYIYTDVTPKRGNVIVKYVSDTGITLKADRTDTSDAVVGTPYNTNEAGENPTIITTADGSTYGKIRVQGNETGRVVEGTTTVTYVYTLLKSPKGDVVVGYIDEDGKTLKDSRLDTPESPVGTPYNTNESGENPQYIDAADGIRYEKIGHKGNESGKVVEGTTTVDYIYRAMGMVVVDYVDENGNKLINSRVGKNWSSLGSDYDVSEGNPRVVYRNGVRYEVERVVGQEKGKVGKGRTTVTYVYRKVDEPTTPTTPTSPTQPANPTSTTPGQAGSKRDVNSQTSKTVQVGPDGQPIVTEDGQEALPETGDSSDASAVLGATLLGSLMAGLAFSRKKKED